MAKYKSPCNDPECTLARPAIRMSCKTCWAFRDPDLSKAEFNELFNEVVEYQKTLEPEPEE